MIIKVGITGQSGFIGTHLYNFLGLYPDLFERIPFEDNFFDSQNKLLNFIKECDTIVHLAALNRYSEPEILYKTNIGLVEKIISATRELNHFPHIIFASSTQEERDNPYGQSKKEGRLLFKKWSEEFSARFTGLIIPNVFGPFGRPFYNSVISTFSYQIINDLKPEIIDDNLLPLIYINDLVAIIASVIREKISNYEYRIKETEKKYVSEILNILQNFDELYIKQNIIPKLNDKFERDLFNTFRSYIDIKNFYPRVLQKFSDERGCLSEMIKEKNGGQVFFSSTNPGFIRGNHFHQNKIERFCVIKGEAIIRLRRIGTDEIIEFKVNGNEPSVVDIPIFYTHNIENVGKTEMLCLFWSNEIYDENSPDTFFEVV